ncbi:hypothetical protein C8Q78DRAFT_38191 [Trametes maxima]|nr:hypothetical protein C8Q78DRAFT_38191 [Trametes maxima]
MSFTAESSRTRPLPLPPSPTPSSQMLQGYQPQEITILDESIRRLEPMAEDEVEEVSKMLDSLPLLHGRQEVEDIAKKLVEGVHHVLEYLDVVAQLHPIAGIVVGAFRSVVKLEIGRHENDAHIVVVHTTMVKTVYHLKFLTRVQSKLEDDLKEQMNVIFRHMSDTIRDFGAFVNTYHTCWQKTYKMLFSPIHRRKLESFNGRFQQHKEDLDTVKSTITHMQLAALIDNTEQLLDNTDDILKRLQIDDPDVRAAEAFVSSHGGPEEVRKNSDLIDRVAALLHEKVTAGMKENLELGFDGLMEKHAARYLKKLESVQDSVIASVSASQAVILTRLDAGPHELVEDSELREIWKRNGWKSTVKCRVFVEGLHEYYQRQFHTNGAQVVHKDTWTLAFFSRVMFHSAIGDVVDDDGSGYISASELNDFISEQRCLPHWSKPQWFAFWACGWYNNNSWYYHRIKAITQDIEKTIHQAERAPMEDRGSWSLIRVVTDSLKPLVLAADVEDFSSTVKVPHQLRRLQEEYRAYEEEKIAKNLAHFDHHLVDRASLHYAVGDTRIELHMMALLYILVTQLQGVVSEIAVAKRVHNKALVTIEELATSCIAVFVAFENRMRDLVRGWRFEGKDIGMQVDRYADGLFRKCYREAEAYDQAYHILRGCIFGDDHTLPRHLRPVGSTRRIQTSMMRELEIDIATLSHRMRELEKRFCATKSGASAAVIPRSPSPRPSIEKGPTEPMQPPLRSGSRLSGKYGHGGLLRVLKRSIFSCVSSKY